MTPQDRCRRHRADLALETRFHRLRLALIRNHGEDFFCLENLLRRHGNGLLRYLRNIGEPRLAYLLLATRLIEVDDDIRLFGIEISGWIVEGNVPVLADAEERNVNRRR